MKPLYCFKFDDITGEVKRIVITDYVRIDYKPGKYGFKFISYVISKNSTYFFVDHKKMDRFVTNKVFTFHEDFEYAYQIMLETMQRKRDSAKREASRQQSMIDKLVMNMGKNEKQNSTGD